MTLSERHMVWLWMAIILAIVVILLIGLPFASFQMRRVDAAYESECVLSGAQGHFVSGAYLYGVAEDAIANLGSAYALGAGDQKYDICANELTDDYVGILHANKHRYVNRSALFWVSPKGS